MVSEAKALERNTLVLTPAALTTHILFAGSRDDDTHSMPDVRSRELADTRAIYRLITCGQPMLVLQPVTNHCVCFAYRCVQRARR